MPDCRASCCRSPSLDIVFSLDSVITAVGMVSQSAGDDRRGGRSRWPSCCLPPADHGFVERHPTVKMLVFSFLLLIGMTLVADGFGMHVPKGYIYAAIGFSSGVETLNQIARAHGAARCSAAAGRRAGEPDEPARDETRSSASCGCSMHCRIRRGAPTRG